jgi:hypothetical protein
MKIWISAAAALLIAAPAFGAQITGAGGAANQIETGQSAPEGRCQRGQVIDGERCICRRVQAETSTRTSVRNTCMTAKQWKQWERER